MQYHAVAPRPLLNRITISTTLALVLLSIKAYGYVFGSGDHNDQLPIIRRLLDPSYLQQDWYVNITSGLSVRSVFSLGMAGLARVVGLDSAYLLVYLAAVLILSAATLLIATSLWHESGIGLIALLIVLFNRTGGVLGGSRLMSSTLVPALISYAGTLLAAFLLYRGRHAIAITLFGLIGLVHPLVGPEAASLFFTATLLTVPRRERKALLRKLPLLLIVLGASAAMGVVLKQDAGSAINPAEVMHILAFQRAPWHYVPWLWPTGTWVRFIGFASLVGIARWRVPRVPWLDWLVISIVLFCVLGLAGFFIRPLVSTIILQPFRMMVFFQLAGALYLGYYIWGLFSDPGALRRVVGTLLLAALLMGQWYTDSFFLVLAVLMLLFEASQYLQRRFSTPTVGRWLCALIPMIIVLTLIVYGVSLLRERDDLVSALLALGSMGLTIISVYAQQRTHYQRLTLATAGLAIFIMGGLLGAAWAGVASRSWLRRITRNLDVQIQRNSLFDQVGGWARLHTAPDATFLTPPYELDFRLTAERAIVIDFTIPLSDAAMLAWRDRLYDVVGGQKLPLGYTWRQQLRDAYGDLSEEQLIQIARKYHATYIIVEHQRLTLPPLYRNERFTIYQVD